jgi:hypothetical protein
VVFPVPSAVPADADAIYAAMLETLPNDYAGSYYVQSIFRSVVDELSSLEEALKLRFSHSMLATADSDALEDWERLAGLSINPSSYTVEQRRERLIAHLIGHYDYLGSDFVANVALLANGATPIRDIDSGAGVVTLTFPTSLSTAQIDEIISYCESSGPAHYIWEVESDNAVSGFVVGTDPATPPGSLPAGKVGFTKI